MTTDRSYCFLCCCTGDRSKAAVNTSSTMESLSRKLVSYWVLRSWFKTLMLALFLIFTGLSIWQTCSFKIGDYNPELLTRSSYYRKFAEINDRVFTSDVYVTFVIPGSVLYKDRSRPSTDISVLKDNLAANDNIDLESFTSWIGVYEKFLNTSGPVNGSFDRQITIFLSSHSQFKNDFALDKSGNIISSRVYVKSRNVRNFEDIRLLKESLLKDHFISESTSKLDRHITLYSPTFIFVDKHSRPLTESLIQIGILIATDIILTTLACPNLRFVIIQLCSLVTTVIGIFGLMSVFSIEMTTFSMIIVVFGMCYIASINTHMIYSFYNTVAIDRQSRAHTVLTTTSVSSLNLIIASLLGLLALLLIKSYIFVTVMHILMIALALSFVQAALIYPISLSIFGPDIPQDDIIVKKIAVPHTVLNGLKASDPKACEAYENPNFSKEDK